MNDSVVESESADVSTPLTSLIMRLKTGEVFNSFDEFKDILDKYVDIVGVPFSIGKSETAESYNKRVSSKSQIPVAFKYRKISFCCIHYGTYSGSKGRGLRETS